MMVTTPLTVLEDLMLFVVKICCWSGEKQLRASDLGEGVELPPAELASLGSKKIVDPAVLKVFSTIRSRVRGILEHYGVSFCGGYAVQAENAEKVLDALKECEADFLAAKRRFLADYDKNLSSWISQHQEWKSMLSSSQLSAGEVEKRISFAVQIFQVTPPANQALSEGVARETEGLASELLREIARDAGDAWRRVFDGKSEVSHRALSPLMGIKSKIENSLYLAPQVAPICRLIDETMQALPAKGYMSGPSLLLLKSLTQTLMDPEKILERAAAITSGTTVEEVHKQFLAGFGNGSDAAVEEEASESTPAEEQEAAQEKIQAGSAPVQQATVLDSAGLW